MGATACIIYITKENGKRVLYSANIGDTRSLLISSNNIDLSNNKFQKILLKGISISLSSWIALPIIYPNNLKFFKAFSFSFKPKFGYQLPSVVLYQSFWSSFNFSKIKLKNSKVGPNPFPISSLYSNSK